MEEETPYPKLMRCKKEIPTHNKLRVMMTAPGLGTVIVPDGSYPVSHEGVCWSMGYFEDCTDEELPEFRYIIKSETLYIIDRKCSYKFLYKF